MPDLHLAPAAHNRSRTPTRLGPQSFARGTLFLFAAPMHSASADGSESPTGSPPRSPFGLSPTGSRSASPAARRSHSAEPTRGSGLALTAPPAAATTAALHLAAPDLVGFNPLIAVSGGYE